MRWKMKESGTPTTSISPWTCLAATMAGWNSIQGNSIQGRVPRLYSYCSLCKIMRKITFGFLLTLNSNKTLHSLCSLFLFGRKIRGEMLTEIKKALKLGKNKYCAILLGSHVPLICLHTYKHVHTHYIFIIHIILIYKSMHILYVSPKSCF